MNEFNDIKKASHNTPKWYIESDLLNKSHSAILEHFRNWDKNLFPCSGKKIYQKMKSIKNSLQLNENKEKDKNKNKNKKSNGNTKHKLLSMKQLEKNVRKRLLKFYVNKNYFNILKIDEIINNEKSHVVSEFKDFLVIGDTAEFILEYYPYSTTRIIYPQILDYYNQNLFIFPNYVTLPESKYIYNNIQKKQKIIDIQEENNKNENNHKDKDIKIKKIFSEDDMDSILNQTNTSGLKQYFGLLSSKSDTENSNYIDERGKQVAKLINKINEIEEKNKSKSNQDTKKSLNKINPYDNSNNVKKRNSKDKFRNNGKKNNKNLSQPNANSKVKNDNKSLKNFINFINKNSFKEKTQKNKTIDKEVVMNDVSRQSIDNSCNQNNEKNIFKKKIKKYDLISQESSKSYNNANNIIKVNKNIINVIINNKKTNHSIHSYDKLKNYKQLMINPLKKSKEKDSSSKIRNKVKRNNNSSLLDSLIEKYTTINAKDKSFSMTNIKFFKNDKKFFKLKSQSRNHDLFRNRLSSGYKNMSISSYRTKNFNFFQKSKHKKGNSWYKLKSRIKNSKILSINSNIKHLGNDLLLLLEDNQDNHKNKINKSNSKIIFEQNKLSNTKNINEIKIHNELDQSKKKISNINMKYINKIKSKSPSDFVKNRNFPITDRKRNEINMEKIESLTNKMKKMKEHFKGSSDKNIFSLSSILTQKISSSKKNKAKEIYNYNNYNNNIIKVYLINKTRNKSKKIKNNNNSQNFPSNDSIKNNIFNLVNTYRKEDLNLLNSNFQTINYRNSMNILGQKSNKNNSKNKNRTNINYHK